MGIVGAMMVAARAYSLMRDSGKILLDAEMDAPVAQEIRQTLATAGHSLTLTDLHLGRIGKGKYHCVIALSSTDRALTADRVRQLLPLIPNWCMSPSRSTARRWRKGLYCSTKRSA